MEIQNVNEAYAGGQFYFTVLGADGPTQISAYISGQLIGEFECPDPPCHEMLALPTWGFGASLEVRAEDSSGQVATKTFSISGPTGTAGGSFTAQSS